MMLKPQDVFILLKLVSLENADWTYSSLAKDLFMSPSEVHSAIKRATVAKLFDSNRKRPIKQSLQEYILHGVKYAYPPEVGGLTRGIPTGHAGPPLQSLLSQSDENPPVWPDPAGQVRGYSFAPLFRSVPQAVAIDPKLYELLVLVDAIRGGRARERGIAAREIQSRIA